MGGIARHILVAKIHVCRCKDQRIPYSEQPAIVALSVRSQVFGKTNLRYDHVHHQNSIAYQWYVSDLELGHKNPCSSQDHCQSKSYTAIGIRLLAWAGKIQAF